MSHGKGKSLEDVRAILNGNPINEVDQGHEFSKDLSAYVFSRSLLVLFYKLLGQFGQDDGVLFLLAFGHLQILLDVLGKKVHQTDQMEYLLQLVGHHERLHTGPVIDPGYDPSLAEREFDGVLDGFFHGHVLDPFDVGADKVLAGCHQSIARDMQDCSSWSRKPEIKRKYIVEINV